MNWMLMPLRRYAQFSGRSQRKEFWLYIVFIVVASLVLGLLDHALGLGGRHSEEVLNRTGVLEPGGNAYSYSYSSIGYTRPGLLQALFSLATFIPSLAVSVRRLHDIDRSGWWVLVPVLPYLGGVIALFGGSIALGGLLSLLGLVLGIALLVFYCMDGTRGPNRFGLDPKGRVADLPRA